MPGTIGAPGAHVEGADMTALPLAESLAARLCHDLAGLVGTLQAALEMAADGDPEALELGQESARLLSARLRLLRAAWAGAADPLTGAELRELAAALPGLDRVRVELAGLADPLAPGADRAILNLLLLGGASLPLGGTLALDRSGPALLLRLTGPRVVRPDHPAEAVLAALGTVAWRGDAWSWQPAPGT
jgi:hypothetical protein